MYPFPIDLARTGEPVERGAGLHDPRLEPVGPGHDHVPDRIDRIGWRGFSSDTMIPGNSSLRSDTTIPGIPLRDVYAGNKKYAPILRYREIPGMGSRPLLHWRRFLAWQLI